MLTLTDIALSIPDFEGQAILRIFSNSTQTEIACYTAEITNGRSFGQPVAIGTILGIFTIVAIVSSVATAIYGSNIPEMRVHYAHSLSLLVVFAVFHHIYFTGALSMNWPSVLVGWWSNYAWTAGMIYSSSMQNSITSFMGKFQGNTLAVGAASAGADSTSVGGGFDVHKIYRRFSTPELFKKSLAPGSYENNLHKRDLLNATDGFKWYGDLVRTGLPLPGNYSGFAGTLSKENIPAANAFLTGLIWLIICIAIIAGSMVLFRFILEGLYRFKIMKTERLSFFRTSWLRYLTAIVLRIIYIAFFMMMFLTIFQFTYNGAPGALALAAIVFVIMLIGVFGIVGYACYYRMRHGTWVSEPDRLFVEKSKGFMPWYHFYRGSKVHDSEKVFAGSFPSWRIDRTASEEEIVVHQDEQFILKFGWLASRFRSSRWWFFAFWTLYEFVRACFYGGASGHALVQVFCLLILEFVAFMAIIKLKPYEGQRLNIIMVWLLGLSKVMTVALSSAFDINFNLERIPATAIGIVIIIIQGILTIVLLVCIALSAISSYFSITRYRAEIKPKKWIPHREKYFAHITHAATDAVEPKYAPKPIDEPEVPRDPYFSVNSVKRIAKIEDEDAEFQSDIMIDPRNMEIPMPSEDDITSVNNRPTTPPPIGIRRQASIAASLRSNASKSSLPHGAVLHRGSWTTRDFQSSQAEIDGDAGFARSNPSSPVGTSFPRNVFSDPGSPVAGARSPHASKPSTPKIGTSAAIFEGQTSDGTSPIDPFSDKVTRSPSGAQRRIRRSDSVRRKDDIDEENPGHSSSDNTNSS
jgi:hypothetical protein